MARIVAFLGFFLVLIEPAHAQLAQQGQAFGPIPYAQGALDTLNNDFAAHYQSWMSYTESVAKHIFAGLAMLELGYAGLKWLLQKNDIGDFVAGLLLKLVGLLFFYTVLTMAPSWVPTIINSLAGIGQSFVANGNGLTPSALIGFGWTLAANIIASVSVPGGGFMAAVENLGVMIVGGLCGIIIIVAYGLMAVTLLMTLIEAYIVIGACAVMLGFLGSSWTTNWGEKYVSYAVTVGIKLMVAYLVLGIGSSLIQAQTNDFQQAYQVAIQADTSSLPPAQTPVGTAGAQPNAGQAGQAEAAIKAVTNSAPTGTSLLLQDVEQLASVAFIISLLSWHLPGIVSTALSGSPTMSLGSAAGALMGAAGAIGAAGMAMRGAAAGGVAGVSGAASGAVGIARATSAAVSPARAAGPMDRLASLGDTMLKGALAAGGRGALGVADAASGGAVSRGVSQVRSAIQGGTGATNSIGGAGGGAATGGAPASVSPASESAQAASQMAQGAAARVADHGHQAVSIRFHHGD